MLWGKISVVASSFVTSTPGARAIDINSNAFETLLPALQGRVPQQLMGSVPFGQVDS